LPITENSTPAMKSATVERNRRRLLREIEHLQHTAPLEFQAGPAVRSLLYCAIRATTGRPTPWASHIATRFGAIEVANQPGNAIAVHIPGTGHTLHMRNDGRRW
jgi:hypothetical protein